MSDPLSITAGIVGILSFGIQVTQALLDLYSVHKDRDADIAKITKNLRTLRETLRSLESAVQNRQAQTVEKNLIQEVYEATQRCREIIKELEIEYQKLQTVSAADWRDRVRDARRRVAYPFRKSTLQKIEEDIGEIRENLSLALNVFQLKSHNRIEDEISEVKSLLERINSSQISLAIRAWLSAPDASQNHEAVYTKRHPNTGLWLLNSHQFANWLIERNSFLWLNGFAGCGKSVLCSIAIQHTYREAKQRDGVGIAFYYFSFSDESKQDKHGMLRALLLQLSVQCEGGQKELEQLHELFQTGTPSAKDLLEPFRKFLGRFQDTYLLLDALDECPRDHGRGGVLEVIQTIRDWCLPGVHLLVTSRDLSDIRASLNPSQGHDLRMENPGINKDIADFVSYQLESDEKLQKWKVRRGEIREKLIDGAQGVFRYVECQLQAFRRARNRNQLDECLLSLPRGLDETYERILCSIDQIYVDDVRRILTVLCFSGRPLTVDELIDAHAVELGESPCLDREGRSYEREDLVDICLGLIEIRATEDDDGQTNLNARIAHFSVQEYLQSDRIRQQKAQRFAIQSGPANTEMAQICLTYLLDSTLSSGTLDRAKLERFPLAYFAAMQWFDYYASAQEGKSKANTLVSRIFHDKTCCFVTWVRLHDIDRRWDKGIHFERRVDDIASPVYYAALLGLDIILKSILTNNIGAERLSNTVNAQGGFYSNALQAASAEGHQEVVQILLERGADVNAQGGLCSNALQAASIRGHQKVVQMLLDRGADVNAQGGHYSNALQAASAEGHQEVVQILLDRGADVNAQGGFYSNALQAASVRDHQEVVQMLLDRGACPDASVRQSTIAVM